MKFQRAVIIGRFQPFHFGHLYLVKKSLEMAEKVIIGIGSASIFDKNNPFDFYLRKKMIEKVFEKEGLRERLLKIVDLEDFFDDKKWFFNVKKKIGDFDILVGNNEWTNKIMEEKGVKVMRLPYYKRFLYEGWRIRRLFLKGKNWQDRVPRYLVSLIKNYFPLKKPYFNNVVLGGTFDHFHKGHQKFLEKAFEVGEKVLIGITSDKMIKDKFLSSAIESFFVRKENVCQFLMKKNWQERGRIIKINDFTGGVDRLKNVEAIIVSKNTYQNALKINDLREKNGFKKMRIVIVPQVLASDGKIISSERIRAGEIDRKGRSYWLQVSGFFKDSEKLVLPESLKKELRKPLGRVFSSTKELIKFIKEKNNEFIFAVGDIVSYYLIKNKINPHLLIFDLKTKRKEVDKEVKKTLKNIFLNKIVNQPGTISKDAFLTIKIGVEKILSKNEKQKVFVDGEEDLLALPLILFSPLNSLVFYGHWQLGVVAVEVNEGIKNKVLKLLRKFTA
jgi:pantetheine-phosphate adenylyltransferase